MPNFTTTTTIQTDKTTLSASNSGQYEEVFNFDQEVDNSDAFITLLLNTRSIGQNSMRDCKGIIIRNSGLVGAELQIINEDWSAAAPDTNGGLQYNSYLLGAGEYLYLPNFRKIGYSSDTSSALGASLTNLAPASVKYVDSTANTAEKIEAADTEFDVTDGDFFKAGDLIQVGINDTTATRIEIMRVSAVSTNNLTVERALYGTSAADGDAQTDSTNGAVSGANVHFPIFNIYGNYNSFSTVQTDASGRFSATNFFGYGRAADQVGDGIVPGSISGRFYQSGYQEFGLSGITNNTDSSLSANTAYYYSVALDGGSTDATTFTVGGSTNFGGSSGVIAKIQDSLDALFKDPSKNNFQKKATVSLVNGDIRVTSGQHLSTSAVALTTNTAGTSGTDELFDGSNKIGRIPVSASAAVDARLPDATITDRRTGITKPNIAQMFYDDGHGNIKGTCSGTIVYETGKVNITNAPTDANFVISANYGSAHAGGNEFSTTLGNCITQISARSCNQDINTTISILGIK